MSIDLEDTINDIRGMITIIDPEQDFYTIAAAEEQMNLTEEARRKELEDTHSRLRTLARALEAARISSTRPPTVPSAEAHTATLNELDQTRLSLVKAINDAESASASKEAELARLREEISSLEASDPAAEHDLDATTLRLSIYKGLGFEPVVGKDGRLAKMLVRAKSGDVHCVTFEGGKSDYEYAQLLWKLTSS